MSSFAGALTDVKVGEGLIGDDMKATAFVIIIAMLCGAFLAGYAMKASEENTVIEYVYVQDQDESAPALTNFTVVDIYQPQMSNPIAQVDILLEDGNESRIFKPAWQGWEIGESYSMYLFDRDTHYNDHQLGQEGQKHYVSDFIPVELEFEIFQILNLSERKVKVLGYFPDSDYTGISGHVVQIYSENTTYLWRDISEGDTIRVYEWQGRLNDQPNLSGVYVGYGHTPGYFDMVRVF